MVSCNFLFARAHGLIYDFEFIGILISWCVLLCQNVYGCQCKGTQESRAKVQIGVNWIKSNRMKCIEAKENETAVHKQVRHKQVKERQE